MRPSWSTNCPIRSTRASLIEKIAELVKHKKLEGIRYIRDESDREGMRIAVGLKKGQMSGVVLNQLYKHTRMESSFGIIFLAVVNQRPQLLSLKGILQHFIRHRKDIVVKRTRYDLKKAEERAHLLEGLKIALDHLDRVVALIRGAASPAEAKAALVQQFELEAHCRLRPFWICGCSA